jgi:glycosyltransferase involved in cell wall biosynthesis
MSLNDQNMQTKLSLVVATIGRVDELERLFDSLCHQSMGEFEIIVIDQSAGDMQPDIEGLTVEFGRKFPVRYVRDEGRGLSRARNLGLRYASGEYVGFPDDDCWYSEGVVEQVITFFNKNPNFTILSGCYTEPNVKNPSFPDVGVDLSTRNLIGRVSSVGIFLNLRGVAKHQIQFDEQIGAGTSLPAGEETDLILRLLLQDFKGSYDPKLVIFHKIFREKATTQEQYFALRKSYWYVVGKNYQFFLTEVKLIKGVVACFIKKSSFGFFVQVKSMVTGYLAGLSVRRRRGL